MVILENVGKFFGKNIEIIELFKLVSNFKIYSGSLDPTEIIKFCRHCIEFGIQFNGLCDLIVLNQEIDKLIVKKFFFRNELQSQNLLI